MTQDNWKAPIHPGEILADELEFIDMNAVELAKHIHVPDNRIYNILNHKRAITADTALRLGTFFGTGPNFWINLQTAFELDIARQQNKDILDSIVPYQQS